MTAPTAKLLSLFQSEASPHVVTLRKSFDALALSRSDRSALARAGSAVTTLAALAELAEQSVVARGAYAIRAYVSAEERSRSGVDAATLNELKAVLSLCERVLGGVSSPAADHEDFAALATLEARVQRLTSSAPLPSPARTPVEARAPARERSDLEARAQARERSDVEARAQARERSDVEARAQARERSDAEARAQARERNHDREPEAARPAGRSASAETSMPRCDARLSELFRQDLASSASQLDADLVQLESARDPESSLGRLMRAAHSLKGAARAVGVDRLVELAHELEECFVAAQRSELVLEPARVDTLLAASDVLNGLAHATPAEFEQELEARHDELQTLSRRVRSLRAPPLVTERPAAPQLEPASEAPPLTTVFNRLPPKPADNDAGADDRVVRVAARSVERLVGLSAEALVQARRTDAFAGALEQLRQRQAALLDGVEAQAPRGQVDGLREQVEACRRITAELAPALDQYMRAIEDLTGRLYREALQSRMRPFAEAVQSLPRLARDAARTLEKRVVLSIAGERTQVDRDVLESLQMPLQHLVRNAIDHGIESPAERIAQGKEPVGALRIEARHHAGMLAITVADDGRGVDLPRLRQKLIESERVNAEHAPQLSEAELLRFLFLPGLSTAARVTDLSGRGVGLDVVQSTVEASGGSVRVSTQSGRGTSFHLQLPVTRSVIRALIVEVGGDPYALPLMRVERMLKVQTSAVRLIEQRQCVELDGEHVGLVRAHELLETPSGPTADELVVIVLREQERTFGLVVDRFVGEQDLVVRPLDRRLGKVPNVAAASLLNDGAPVLILDLDDLVSSIKQLLQRGPPAPIATSPREQAPRQHILVVDDSLIVRELHKQMLMGQGYDVTVAVDGMDGWLAMQRDPFRLVVTDIDMPRLNGFELVRRIKQDVRTRATPVIIVSYKDREEDRLRGLEVGADYYLTKSSFHDRALLDAVHDLLGEPP